jgi:hypothetical protein
MVNHSKPRVQTLVLSRYPTPALVHDFILLFLPPWCPHLTPLAIESLETSLLISPLLGGPARHRPLRLLFTCTNSSQAATCTCNTQPRVSSHHIVNHSSHQVATIHWSSDALVLISLKMIVRQISSCKLFVLISHCGIFLMMILH